jgi:hypothetical protein
VTVGFHLDYQRSDECFATLQVARVAEHCGHDVQLLPASKAGPVQAYWDQRVLRNYKHDYPTWLRGLSHVVFCNVPPVEVVLAAQSQGTRTVLVCQWADLEEAQLPALEEFDSVICPAKCVYRHLSRHERVITTSLTAVPWDAGAPLTSNAHPVDPRRVGVLWYLDGSQPLVQDLSFVDVVGELLKLPFVYMTVLHTGRLSEHGLARVRALQQAADGRLELVRNASWEKMLLTIAAHDLMLWPSAVENFGLPGLMAATVGTPSLAYDHPVVGEVIRDGVNGILVPCDLAYNWLGVPGAVAASNEAFLAEAIRLVSDPSRLERLRTTVHHRLARRRQSFNTAISGLFNR